MHHGQRLVDVLFHGKSVSISRERVDICSFCRVSRVRIRTAWLVQNQAFKLYLGHLFVRLFVCPRTGTRSRGSRSTAIHGPWPEGPRAFYYAGQAKSKKHLTTRLSPHISTIHARLFGVCNLRGMAFLLSPTNLSFQTKCRHIFLDIVLICFDS